METDRLKYFCTIAETGSLTKAAELLHVSHSGLSKAMSALEAELEVKLFQPQGRGLEITSEGKSLYPKALEILKTVNALRAKTELQTEFVRIGLSEVLSTSCAGFIAQEIKGALSLNRTESGLLESKIINGEYDFGLAFVPQPIPEMEYLEIGKVEFAAHARKDLADSSDAKEIPFAGPTLELAPNPLNFRNRDGWPHDIARVLTYSASSFSIALDLVKRGVCAAYIPSFIAGLENETLPTKYQLKELLRFKAARTERKLYLVKPKNSLETSAMKKAAKVARKICCK